MPDPFISPAQLPQRTSLSLEMAALLAQGFVQEAFERLYHRLFTPIYAYIKARVTSASDAEDLTQEVFLAAYRNLAAYDIRKAGAETWIYLIARNKVSNYYRDQKPTVSMDDEENPLFLESGQDLEEALVLQRKRDLTAELLLMLDPLDRCIVVLRYLMDRTTAETAEATGLSDGNVRVRLSRALRRMEEAAARYGLEV